jgi:hypothetical protein
MTKYGQKGTKRSPRQEACRGIARPVSTLVWPWAGHAALWTRACKSWTSRRSKKMLWTICIILLVLWALGLATSYTAGGLIHILLVVAVLVLIFRLIQGRRIV